MLPQKITIKDGVQLICTAFVHFKNGRPGNSWPFVTVVGGVTNRTLHRHLLQTRTQRKLCEKSDKKMRNNSKDVLWPLQLQFYVMTEC